MTVADTMTATVSTDGTAIISYHGWQQGTVIRHSTFRNGRANGEQHAWRVRTPDGREWHGRNGGPGLAVTLRPALPRKRRDGTRYGA